MPSDGHPPAELKSPGFGGLLSWHFHCLLTENDSALSVISQVYHLQCHTCICNRSTKDNLCTWQLEGAGWPRACRRVGIGAAAGGRRRVGRVWRDGEGASSAVLLEGLREGGV